jgi:hypothetical protein
MRNISSPWAVADERERLLRIVQPGLIGLIDGTISTLAPDLRRGLPGRFPGGVPRRSRGVARRRHLDGDVGGVVGRRRAHRPGQRALARRADRRGHLRRRHAHALPFLIDDTDVALRVAYVVVAFELVLIALLRQRYLHVSLRRS